MRSFRVITSLGSACILSRACLKRKMPRRKASEAHEADDALRYTVAAFPGLQLMTYEVTFELNPVD
jgi:hypothetical protein